MNVILFCQQEQQTLLPLTFLKPAGELRMGIFTFNERWQKLLDGKNSYLTDDYFADLYPITTQENNYFIHSAYFPTHNFVQKIKNLKKNEGIKLNDQIIAFHGSKTAFDNQLGNFINWTEDLMHIQRPYDLFSFNDKALQFDFEFVTRGRESQPISQTNGVIHPEKIFLEEGAKVEFSVLNATDGPIYIGKNAEILEGSLVRGGLALCHDAKLNMGSKIYGATTVGPWCKVGGEVNNSILTAYSNKGHEGFLGNSVIGEWCNLGADTNNSNLKNNYGEVKLWNYESKKFDKTGLQFCGLIMGDHAKSAINTQFNTGTVVGTFANIFRAGFPPNKIENFSWGGFSGDEKFRIEAAYDTAEKMMGRRKVQLTDELKEVIKYVFNSSEY